jgi:large subunit ribosomal protein L9
MEVILLERIENLGQMGDVVRVRPGFARNFLLPQRKALRASKESMAVFERERAQLEAENLKRKGEAESVAQKLEGLNVVVIRQAGDSGQLYGSVSSRDIAEAIGEKKATVGRGQIVLDRPIKVLGLHPVRLRLHPEVSVKITVNVARTAAEAEIQAKTGHIVTLEEQRTAIETASPELLGEEETEASEA